jgi:hypothetical protein
MQQASVVCTFLLHHISHLFSVGPLCLVKRPGLLNDVFYVLLEGQQGFQQSWVKLNEHVVCFEGMHNRYGSFNNYIRKGMVTAIKLEWVSGEIRCIGGVEYNSRWGCNGYAPFAQYPLNVVVTDRYNHVLFPKKDYIV